MSKIEYRLKTPNNILFLIHYLEIKTPSVPIRTSLPAAKISPVYLQQQFFQQLKQQMAQMTSIRRFPSPGPTMMSTTSAVPNRPLQAQAAKNGSSLQNQNRSNSNSTVNMKAPPQQSTATNLPESTPSSQESTIDLFDSFGDFEAAFYRLNVINPLLRRLFEMPSTNSMNNNSNSLKTEIENDLIAATRKKISTTEDRLKNSHKNHRELVNNLKKDQERFWDLFDNLLNGVDDGTDLSISFKLLQSENNFEMEVDEDPKQIQGMIYTSL